MAKSKYTRAEEKRLKEVKQKLVKEELKLAEMPVSSNEFMDQYALVNELRLMKETILSRIINMGNFPFMPDHHFLTN